MGKTSGKKGSSSTVSATSTVASSHELVPRLDPGLQSLLNYGDNIEEFLGFCAHLPGVLTEDLRSVAALDAQTHKLTAELSREQAEVLERAKAKFRQATRPEHLEDLVDEVLLEQARKKRRLVDDNVNEKMNLTNKMYNALDDCITRIDDEIAKLEQDVKDSYGAMPDFASLAPEAAAEIAAQQKDAAAAAANGTKATGAGGQGKGDAGAGGTRSSGAAGGGRGSARVEEPVNPNEPLYCVCRRVGFGEMIGCDNEDCEHGEWFHYKCVGLDKVAEISYWLCPGCTADAKEREIRDSMSLSRAPKLAVRATDDVGSGDADGAVKLGGVKERGEGDEDDDDDDEEEEEEEQEGEGRKGSSPPHGASAGGDSVGNIGDSNLKAPADDNVESKRPESGDDRPRISEAEATLSSAAHSVSTPGGPAESRSFPAALAPEGCVTKNAVPSSDIEPETSDQAAAKPVLTPACGAATEGNPPVAAKAGSGGGTGDGTDGNPDVSSR